ncbi:MAG: porin [Saprospiraceae bacterium]|nr:porin [Saprospiraceae bacterium]
MIRSFFALFVYFLWTGLQAQVSNTGLIDTASSIKINALSIGGYIDLYYGQFTGSKFKKQVPYFVSMANGNEVNVNLAYLDLRYSTEDIRVRLVPGFGTYINANYASETGSLKNLVEASAGVCLSKKRNIWLDAGVLGSPYTNESAISKDHLMYTRSFAPEYVPYYLAGVKLSLPISSKFTSYVYLLNGWQQITDNNRSKALGTQLEYRPDDKNLINWNTYVGDESSWTHPEFSTRYFTDIYWIHNPDGKFSLTTSAYVGNQIARDSSGKKGNHMWWQANVIGRLRFNPKFSLSGRVEYFDDEDAVQISPLYGDQGFRSSSAGLCFDFKLRDNALLRFEGRRFFAADPLYINGKGLPSRQMTWVISNFTVWF